MTFLQHESIIRKDKNNLLEYRVSHKLEGKISNIISENHFCIKYNTNMPFFENIEIVTIKFKSGHY